MTKPKPRSPRHPYETKPDACDMRPNFPSWEQRQQRVRLNSIEAIVLQTLQELDGRLLP